MSSSFHFGKFAQFQLQLAPTKIVQSGSDLPISTTLSRLSHRTLASTLDMERASASASKRWEHISRQRLQPPPLPRLKISWWQVFLDSWSVPPEKQSKDTDGDTPSLSIQTSLPLLFFSIGVNSSTDGVYLSFPPIPDGQTCKNHCLHGNSPRRSKVENFSTASLRFAGRANSQHRR